MPEPVLLFFKEDGVAILERGEGDSKCNASECLLQSLSK